MDQPLLSARLPSAIAGLRFKLTGTVIRSGASVAVATAVAFAMAWSASAHEGTPSPPPACGTTLPLTTPCSATVTPPATPGGSYSVVLPGIGTLMFTIDPTTNKVTAASVSSLDPKFTATAVKVDKDGDSITVTFTSTVDSTQVYRVSVKVKPPTTAGGSPTVTAKVKGAHHDDDSAEKEHEGSQEGSHEGSGGGGERD